MHNANQTNQQASLEKYVSIFLENLQKLPKKDQACFVSMFKEMVQNSEIAKSLGVSKEDLSKMIDEGIRRLESDSANESELWKTASQAVDFIKNNPEIVEKVEKSLPNKVVDWFQDLSTKNKLFVGSAAFLIAPVPTLVALVLTVLGLGGMALGKGAVIAGKVAVQGAQVTSKAIASGAHKASEGMEKAGKEIAHAAQVTSKALASGAHEVKEGVKKAGEGIAHGAEVVGEQAKHAAQVTSKATVHGLKNAADHILPRNSNIENFLKQANDPDFEVKDKRKVDFLEEYIQDSDTVKALKNVIGEEGIKIQDHVKECEVSLTQDDLKTLLEKGKSTFRGQDDGKFKEALGKFAPIMDKENEAIQNKFADELSKIKEEKAKPKESKLSSFKAMVEFRRSEPNKAQRG